MRQPTRRKRDTIYTPAVLMLVLIVGISFLGLGLVMPLRALYGRQIGASSTEIGLMTASFLHWGTYLLCCLSCLVTTWIGTALPFCSPKNVRCGEIYYSRNCD